MTRIILSVWIFISSLVAVGTSAGFISSVLAVYPKEHLSSFGPVVPAVATTHASWLPSAPTVLAIFAAISAAAGLYFWRSSHTRETKTFAVTFIAAINYFAAFFCVMTLLIAYFYLPKVANGA